MNTAKILNQINVMQSTRSIEEEAGMNYFGYVIIFNKNEIYCISAEGFFFHLLH